MKKGGKCARIGPFPGNIGKLYHDDSLQLLVSETSDPYGRRRYLDVYRLHWYRFFHKANKAPYQVDVKWLGELKRSGDISVHVDRQGKGFWIKPSKKDWFNIRWADTLEPIDESSHERAAEYFRKPPSGEALDSPVSIEENRSKLVYGNLLIYQSPKTEGTIITAYTFDDKKRYLAYMLANKKFRNSQTLVILDLTKDLLVDNPEMGEDVKLEIAKASFERPPIKEIAFGRSKDEGWLFLRTKDGRYYRTVFGVKQMREKLCENLPEKPGSSYDESAATPIYRILKKNKDGLVFQIDEEEHGPCHDEWRVSNGVR